MNFLYQKNSESKNNEAELLNCSLSRTIDIKDNISIEKIDRTNFQKIMIDNQNLQDYFQQLQDSFREQRTLINEVKKDYKKTNLNPRIFMNISRNHKLYKRNTKI